MHVAMCLVLRLTYVFCCHYEMSSFLHDRQNSKVIFPSLSEPLEMKRFSRKRENLH